MNNRVVVTGIGIVSGFGIGKDIFWENLITDRSGKSLVNEWSLPEIGYQSLVKIPHFEIKQYLPKLKPPYPARYSQMIMIAAALAIQDAQIDFSRVNPFRVGAVLNTDFGPNEMVEKYLVDLFTEGPAAVRPLRFARTVTNVALGDIARYFQLKGPSSMLLGESSVCYGYDLLQDNKADIVLCGGVDELRDLMIWVYKKLGLLSNTTNEVSAEKQGLLLGEAAAVVVLERLEHAIQRKSKIYAEVLSYSETCDQLSNYILVDRTVTDLEFAMRTAIQETGLSPANVELILGCASSHPQSISVELQAIEKIWATSPVKIINIKERLGETFGSASVLSICATALILSNKVIPCSKIIDTSSKTNPKILPLSSNATHLQFALCNSIHIGGNNISMVLSSYHREVVQQ